MKLYLIHSLKWSGTANYEGDIVYWGPNESGYTSNIHHAGIYTEELVMNNQGRYNDGKSTKSIELDVQQVDDHTLGRMLAHYERKLRDQVEYEEQLIKVKQQLESLKRAQVAVRENIAEQRFEINQQLVLRGEEVLRPC